MRTDTTVPKAQTGKFEVLLESASGGNKSTSHTQRKRMSAAVFFILRVFSAVAMVLGGGCNNEMIPNARPRNITVSVELAVAAGPSPEFMAAPAEIRPIESENTTACYLYLHSSSFHVILSNYIIMQSMPR